MMKSTLIKDLYGEIERLKAGELCFSLVVADVCLGIFRFLGILSYW